jgi:hypothetical protein
MSVIKFPTKYKPPSSQQLRVEAAIEGCGKTKSAWGVALGVIVFLWTVVRIPVFLVLYWLRLPVMLLCNVLSIPTLFLFLFAWFAFPEHTTMVKAFGTTSFVAFVGAYCYDMLLMAIAPGDMMRQL